MDMQVELNNQIVNVVIVYKKIKNIYFRFDGEGNLCISANRYTSKKEIEKLVLKNKKALERMMDKQEKKVQKEQEFWYLGTKYDLVFDSTVSEIDFQNGVLTIKDEAMLKRFLNKQIKRIFTEETEYFKNIIKTPPFTLKFRKMKTRWGVCNYKLNTITLNTELIRYSKDDLRYVIVHEMCHFKYHNHSRDFWNMVEEYYPNYKMARKDLKE